MFAGGGHYLGGPRASSDSDDALARSGRIFEKWTKPNAFSAAWR